MQVFLPSLDIITKGTYKLLGPMYGGGLGRMYGLERSVETLKTKNKFLRYKES